MKRSDFVARALVTLLFSYAITIGATFNGILNPQFKFLNLLILFLCVTVWLLVRWRGGWNWHPTPLDAAFILWVLAFTVSLLANPDSWRRTAIGLWYTGLYIGVWYALSDLLANRALKRETLVDGLLISGLIVLIFGYLQLQSWLANGLPLIVSGVAPFNLPRPVSALGNSNALGAFLVALIPLALSRLAGAQNRLSRLGMAIYTLSALLLLFLTFSRGAWLGSAIGLLVWGGFWLAQRDLLSPIRMRGWWSARSARARFALSLAGLALVMVSLVVFILFIASFGQAGRGVEWRTGIYEAAIRLFAEQPLTGSGLFTFGRGLMQVWSSPPNELHSHAHNAGLHLAAELGSFGLIALLVTLGLIVGAVRMNWKQADSGQRLLLTGAVAAVAGFAVHHLFDVPAMMPAVALTGLVALTLVTAPLSPHPVQSRRTLQSVALAALWTGLLASGLWSSAVYNDYVASLRYGVSSGDFRDAAERLQGVIDSDPHLALYHKEQALLYGMAASAGDLDAARLGIDAYSRFLALEPDYAPAWANQAALYWQLGEWEQAIESMEQAVERAPEAWQLMVNLARYSEAMGDNNGAVRLYDQALSEYPDASLYPGLEVLEQRRLLSSVVIELSPHAQVILLLENGMVDEAAALWEPSPRVVPLVDAVVSMLVALAQGEREAALNRLSDAERLAASARDQAWVHLGRARLAQFDGDSETAARELDAARGALERQPFDGDYEYGLNFAHAHYLRLGLPRQFLPQVYYPVGSPILLYLLESTL